MSIDTKELKEMSKDLNVLFVEDDAIVQMLTSQILAVFFNNIEVANNGQEGLDLYQDAFKDGKSGFDLVITDVSMPKLSGVEMARQIVVQNPNQHFIFISAHQENNYADDLDGKGVFCSTTKPVTLESLKSVFNEACLKLQQAD